MTQENRIFEPLMQAFGERIGFRLFTVTRVLPGGTEVERIFSNDLNAYPLHGRKPVQLDAWHEQVFIRQQPFLARQVAEFAPFFPDYAMLAAMGLGCVINFPVLRDGVVVGTINILHEPGFYDQQAVESCQPLQTAANEALLAFDAVANSRP